MPVTLNCISPRPMATHRLVCFPFAGGGPSVFAPWVKRLPDHIELFALHLPGRETKARETPLISWAETIAQASAAIATLPRGPVALFGHSLGALIARDIAHALPPQGRSPEHLFVAGRPWPGAGIPDLERETLLTLSDEAFWPAMAARYGALPQSLQHPDIAAMALPILRADLQLLRDYSYNVKRPLSCGLSVITANEDPITAAADPRAWAAEAAGKFRSLALDSGHYFIDTHAEEICTEISTVLKR